MKGTSQKPLAVCLSKEKTSLKKERQEEKKSDVLKTPACGPMGFFERRLLLKTVTSESIQTMAELLEGKALSTLLDEKDVAPLPVKNVNLIPIADQLVEHHETLTKQGALLTLAQLDHAIEKALKHPPTDFEMLQTLYLLKKGVITLIFLWQQNTLINHTAQIALDEYAIKRLHEKYNAPLKAMAEGRTDEKGLGSVLRERIEKNILLQKEKIFTAWYQSKFLEESKERPAISVSPSAFNSLEYDAKIIEALCQKQWLIDSDHPLNAAFCIRKIRVILELWQEEKLPSISRVAFNDALKQGIYNVLNNKSEFGPRRDPRSPLRPLYDLLQSYFAALLPTAATKTSEQLIAEVAEQLIARWQHKELTEPTILSGLQELLSHINLDALLKGDFHTEIVRNTIKSLFKDYTSGHMKRQGDLIDHHTLERAIHAIFIMRFKDTPEQEENAIREIVIQWKAGSLTSEETREVSDLILREWQQKQIALETQLQEPFTAISSARHITKTVSTPFLSKGVVKALVAHSSFMESPESGTAPAISRVVKAPAMKITA